MQVLREARREDHLISTSLPEVARGYHGMPKAVSTAAAEGGEDTATGAPPMETQKAIDPSIRRKQWEERDKMI